VWMSHGDKVTELPPGFKVISSNAATQIAGMADEAPAIFTACSFTPRWTHTLQGKALFERFLHGSVVVAMTWNMPINVEKRSAGSAPKWVRMKSSLDCPAVWIPRWWPPSCTAPSYAVNLRVRDHGLPAPPNEARASDEDFCPIISVSIHPRPDAGAESWKHMAWVWTDPEQKRKIIGREFVEVFQSGVGKTAERPNAGAGDDLPHHCDVIDSASSKTKKAHTISKSHHNVERP